MSSYHAVAESWTRYQRTGTTGNRTKGDLVVGKKASDRNRADKLGDRTSPFSPPIRRALRRSMKVTRSGALRAEDQRQALVALRARLLENVAVTADAALSGCGIEVTCASPDTADRASEVFEQDLAISLLGNANGTLEHIEAALQRIDDGSYGRCAECGTRIPAARLEAVPYATCCVQCAERQERQEHAT
jgi:DnaK suppressor protein